MKKQLIEDIIQEYTESDDYKNHDFDHLDVAFIANKYSETILPKWINVVDRLPIKTNDLLGYSDYVLAYSNQLFGTYFISRYDHYDNTWAYDKGHDAKYNEITHWTPLLPPPAS